MEFKFYKYHGTGNDFVLIDNRTGHFPKQDRQLVADICHRRFGVGADGLILLEDHPISDFRMVYFNSDGNLSSMCGNGGRCLVKFARFLGIIEDQTSFEAIDGIHEAKIENGQVSLKMADVEEISISEESIFLNTGSPHHIQMVSDIEGYDVFSNGKKIRYGIYGDEGANVNFVEQMGTDIFSVRTYERGVEDETFSCGTGVTAVAIAMYETKKTSQTNVILKTPGGQLQVQFQIRGRIYENIYLKGPAKQVFKGVWK